MEGRQVHIGTSQDLFGQLERTKLEKSILEKNVKTLDQDNRSLKDTLHKTKEDLNRVTDKFEALTLETNRLKKTVSLAVISLL